jgi:hypothetical protein
MKVSALSAEEIGLLFGFHSRLFEISDASQLPLLEDGGSNALPVVLTKILDFALLSMTQLPNLEAELRSIWHNYD